MFQGINVGADSRQNMDQTLKSCLFAPDLGPSLEDEFKDVTLAREKTRR